MQKKKKKLNKNEKSKQQNKSNRVPTIDAFSLILVPNILLGLRVELLRLKRSLDDHEFLFQTLTYLKSEMALWYDFNSYVTDGPT